MPVTASEHDLLTRLDSQASDIRKLLRAIAGLAVAITVAAYYTAFEAGKGAEALNSIRAQIVEVKGEVRDLKADMITVKASLDRIEKAVTHR